MTTDEIQMVRHSLIASEWCGFSKVKTVHELCDLALKGLASVQTEELSSSNEAVRAAWSELLEKVAIQAVLPPKKGYERRAIYLCVEDECDAGGEYVEVFDVSMEELNLLRGMLGPKPPPLNPDGNLTKPAETFEEALNRIDNCFRLAGESVASEDWSLVKINVRRLLDAHESAIQSPHATQSESK